MQRRSFLTAVICGLFAPGIVATEVRAKESSTGDLPTLKSYNLSNIYLSKEALEDVRNWVVNQVDEETRRAIYLH